MALKDVLKGLTGRKQEEYKEEKALAPLVSSQFPIIRASEVDVRKYKQVPLMGLATLGGAFS